MEEIKHYVIKYFKDLHILNTRLFLQHVLPGFIGHDNCNGTIIEILFYLMF